MLLVAVLAPQDSEDQYLKVRDENLQLKKMLHQSARTQPCLGVAYGAVVPSRTRISPTLETGFVRTPLRMQGEKQRLMATKLSKMTEEIKKAVWSRMPAAEAQLRSFAVHPASVATGSTPTRFGRAASAFRI
jgi:hypothetical protein